MIQELRCAVRHLRLNPAFCGFVIATMALSVGANLAVLSIVNSLLLAHLPVTEPRELVEIVLHSSEGELPFTEPLFRELADTQSVVSGVFAASPPIDLQRRTRTGSEKIRVQMVSGEYFSVLDISSRSGRLLGGEDDRVEAPVAVLSEEYWREKLSGDPSILGRPVIIGDLPIAIIGIARAGFRGHIVGEPIDAWMPLRLFPKLNTQLGLYGAPGREAAYFHLIGRNRMGHSMEALESGLQVALNRIQDASPHASVDHESLRLEALPASRGLSRIRHRFSTQLWLLASVVALLFLVALLNISNLLLTKQDLRRTELSTRLALGASARHLIRQLLFEYGILAFLGTASGVLAAAWIRSLILAYLAPPEFSQALKSGFQSTELFFAGAAFLAAFALFGLGPCWNAVRLGSVGSLERPKAPAKLQRLGKLSVVGQVALSSVLLFLAGLFIATLRNLESVDSGFASRGVVQFEIQSSAPTELGHFQDVARRLESLPGVQHASFSMLGLLGSSNARFCCLGTSEKPAVAGEGLEAEFNLVTPGFFDSVGTVLLRGRDFERADSNRGQVAIINRRLAEELLLGETAVGRRVHILQSGTRIEYEVLGVVENANYSDPRQPAKALLFLTPEAPAPAPLSKLLVRLDEDAATKPSDLAASIVQADNRFQASAVETVESKLVRAFAQERMVANLSGAFGSFVLILTAIGLYGAIFYNVVARTREVSLRVALGAGRMEVLWTVMKETLMLLTIGTLGGLALTLACGQLLSGFLFGLSPWSPLMIGMTIVIMIGTTLGASLVPCLRALSINPKDLLRQC